MNQWCCTLTSFVCGQDSKRGTSESYSCSIQTFPTQPMQKIIRYITRYFIWAQSAPADREIIVSFEKEKLPRNLYCDMCRYLQDRSVTSSFAVRLVTVSISIVHLGRIYRIWAYARFVTTFLNNENNTQT